MMNNYLTSIDIHGTLGSEGGNLHNGELASWSSWWVADLVSWYKRSKTDSQARFLTGLSSTKLIIE